MGERHVRVAGSVVISTESPWALILHGVAASIAQIVLGPILSRFSCPKLPVTVCHRTEKQPKSAIT